MKKETKLYLNYLYNELAKNIISLGFKKKRRDLFLVEHTGELLFEITIDHTAKSSGKFIMVKLDLGISAYNDELGRRISSLTGRVSNGYCLHKNLSNLRNKNTNDAWYFSNGECSDEETLLTRELDTYAGENEQAKGIANMRKALADQGMSWIKRTSSIQGLREALEAELRDGDIRYPLLLEQEGHREKAVEWIRKQTIEFEPYAQKRVHLKNALEDFLRLKEAFEIK